MRDLTIDDAPHDDTYACFEAKRDEFYIIRFDFPYALKFNEEVNPNYKPASYDGIGYLEIRDYQSGTYNSERSKVIFGKWSKLGKNYQFDSSGVRANDEAPISSASADDETVAVKQIFEDAAGKETFSLVIQRSTSRFRLEHRYALRAPPRDTELLDGRCLLFKRSE